MARTVEIMHPEVLSLTDGETRQFGADQEWYGEKWQRQSGCGPTNCSHLLWYMAATRPDCETLTPSRVGTRAGFTALMERVWQYVTPGRMGVNSCGMFVEGAERYGRDQGVALDFQVLEVPGVRKRDRPGREGLGAFLQGAFTADRPVAFLNLSNGREARLDNWHWVTLVAFQPETLSAVMYDGGEQTEIDLGLWLDTTCLGGGLVTMDRAAS